jgi:hypothetical protein
MIALRVRFCDDLCVKIAAERISEAGAGHTVKATIFTISLGRRQLRGLQVQFTADPDAVHHHNDHIRFPRGASVLERRRAER